MCLQLISNIKPYHETIVASVFNLINYTTLIFEILESHLKVCGASVGNNLL